MKQCFTGRANSLIRSQFQCNHDAHISTHAIGSTAARHRHHSAYAALILEGGYYETGPEGRFYCASGMVVLHPPFHIHTNMFADSGAAVLNIPIWSTERYGVFNTRHAARLEKLAQTAPDKAALEIIDIIDRPVEAQRPLCGWIERLAEQLRHDAANGSRSLLKQAAAALGVSPAHISRAFKKHFNLTPTQYREEFRFRRSLALLQKKTDIAQTAALTGYADQSHMSREIKRRTGKTPRQFSLR